MIEQSTVLSQLTAYCDCLDVEESDVNELIDLISSFTGWMQNTCETFMKSDRKEVVTVDSCVRDCDVFVFEPYYRPFEVESFEFTLIEQNGLDEIATVIEPVYSMIDENFKMKLPLPDCTCKPKCGCESTYKLVVTYAAGYELIPECLLPLFCEALQYIHDKNVCCSECADCDTQYSEDQIDLASISGNLQAHFMGILTKQYFRALSLISLCKQAGHLWGIVV